MRRQWPTVLLWGVVVLWFAMAPAETLAAESAESVHALAIQQIQQRNLTAARASLEKVLMMAPPDSALAAKARHNITLVSQAQLVEQQKGKSAKFNQVQQLSRSTGGRQEGGSQGNYLSNAIHNGKIIHWDVARMPLKVYIASGAKISGWQPGYKALVSKALQAWQSASFSKLRFTQTPSPQQADIVITWVRQLAHHRVGESPFEARGNVIIRSDVTVALANPFNNTLMSESEIYSTILHELGHALGIQGHSPYADDVMFAMVNSKQTGALTMRDKATLRALYKLEADITNDTQMATAQSKTYYEKLALGSQALQKGQAGLGISALLEAVQQAPDNAKGYFYLGAAYQQAAQTANAVSAYRQAVSLEPANATYQAALGQVLINQGVDAAQRQQISVAKQLFSEAVNRLSQSAQSPEAPPATANALAIARKNLSLCQ
ncbi:MAG: matrixin family metalloprotease [Vampirovibrionales bacterium]|nr:matrixin family metalloprotease [Vampirovibrionales bacterium]